MAVNQQPTGNVGDDNGDANGLGRSNGVGGGMQALGLASNVKIAGPSQNAYNSAMGNAQANGSYYQNAGDQAQGRAGATINNPFQADSRAGLAGTQGHLNDVYNGLGNVANTAQNVFQQNTDASMAGNLALANSQRAGSVGNAGLQRAALQGNAVQGQQAANQSAINYANNQFAGLNAQAGVAGQAGQLGMAQYGLEQGNAQQQAQLQQQNQQANDQYGLGLYGLSQGANQQSNQLLSDYNKNTNAAQGNAIDQQKDAAGSGWKGIQGVGNAISSLAGIF